MDNKIELSLSEKIEMESQHIEELLMHTSSNNSTKTETDVETALITELRKYDAQNDTSHSSVEDDPDFALPDIKVNLLPEENSEKDKTVNKRRVYSVTPRTTTSTHSSPQGKPRSRANRLGQFLKHLVS